MWAWGVKQGQVDAINFFLDPTDKAVDTYQQNRHQQCILPNFTTPPLGPTLPTPPTGTPPSFNLNVPPPAIPTLNTTSGGTASSMTEQILQQLAVSITRQSEVGETHNELVSRQLEHSLETEDKKEDRLKKFHDSIKQLFLFASADDADSVPDDIPDSYERFFNAENAVNAKQELTLQFGNMGMHDATFAPTFIASLYLGKFAWTKNFTPSNFSPFMIIEAEPSMAENQRPRRLILHLEDMDGKSSEEMLTTGKQSVKAPTTYHEMFQQLKFFQGSCKIFFGEQSIASRSIEALISIVERNKHIFKARGIEPTYMSKFLFAIDTRFQLWMESCMTMTSRDQVDGSLLNFIPQSTQSVLDPS